MPDSPDYPKSQSITLPRLLTVLEKLRRGLCKPGKVPSKYTFRVLAHHEAFDEDSTFSDFTTEDDRRCL
jgi:hypothetical protein